MTSLKCQISTLELSPGDNYRPVTMFWPFPEVVTISDEHCIANDFTRWRVDVPPVGVLPPELEEPVPQRLRVGAAQGGATELGSGN